MSHSVLFSGELQNGAGSDDEDSDSEVEVYLRDRRRAKSLPAYPEQASLLDRLSQTCRKRVKFADTLGLSLFSVKHFSSAEEPQIPSKVFSDLCANFRSTKLAEPQDSRAPGYDMHLSPEDTDARVKRCRVALERVSGTRNDIHGFIRVAHLNSGKVEVGVRYTFDEWASFANAPAVPIHGASRFGFTVHTPPGLSPNPLKMYFAVYLRSEQGEFWDNNDGQNYCLLCSRVL